MEIFISFREIGGHDFRQEPRSLPRQLLHQSELSFHGLHYAHNLLSNVSREAFSSLGMNTNPFFPASVCYTFQVACSWQLLLFVYVLIQRVKKLKQQTILRLHKNPERERMQVGLDSRLERYVHLIIDFPTSVFLHFPDRTGLEWTTHMYTYLHSTLFRN